MCEANAYILNGDQEELFFEKVDRVIPEDGQLILENIFGHKKMIKAEIKELALVDHKIILKRS
ncbi:CooT family nickel-binding protein [Dehalobacterium formicoaceticum]|uniref:CooT family nickel-binding protein n=1 Tax=Dehalobacterium formicoaceticum TaxID=51515 RepID=A0ABT1Y7H1_9FIRM|nr:CooT family nickel-binding protein [Dehalobacterium formicoaceticum]MCR6546813.1 CooT family nickel-binding protein [Dehalobacterium formicoaceticum]